jgi:hypothetical protein
MFPLKQAEAKERQREAGEHFGRGMEKLVADPSQAIETPAGRAPTTRKQVADIMGIAEKRVQDVITIAKVAPEKVEQIKRGEIIEGRITTIGNPAFIVRCVDVVYFEGILERRARLASLALSFGWEEGREQVDL